MNNPQYPHRCRVVRRKKSDDNYPDPEDPYGSLDTPSSPEYIPVLDSICQNQIGTSGDTPRKEGVLDSDYCVYVPLPTIYIAKDDLIEIFDTERTIRGRVKQFEPGNLGMRIWVDEDSAAKKQIFDKTFDDTFE